VSGAPSAEHESMSVVKDVMRFSAMLATVAALYVVGG
jgi:hypothetical protein